MFAEYDKIFDPDYVGLLLHIHFFDMTQDLNLYEGLFREAWLIFDDLKCYFFLGLMIECLEDLSI